MRDTMKRLWVEDDAATFAEYGLLLALMAVALIATLKTVGTNLKTYFTTASNDIKGAANK
ncbi:MAG: Flp family type IVb pilin [Pseudomonadota bacterium]